MLNFQEGKGEVSGGDCSGIRWPLRDALDSRTLFSFLLGWKDEEEEGRTGRTGGKKVELLSGLPSTLWFAGGLSLLACSLMVTNRVEGMDGRLFIRRRLAAGALETFEIYRRHCSRSDGRRRGDRHSMPPEKKLR